MPRFSELIISLRLPDSNLSLYVIRKMFDKMYHNNEFIIFFIRNAINVVKINVEILTFIALL